MTLETLTKDNNTRSLEPLFRRVEPDRRYAAGSPGLALLTNEGGFSKYGGSVLNSRGVAHHETSLQKPSKEMG